MDELAREGARTTGAAKAEAPVPPPDALGHMGRLLIAELRDGNPMSRYIRDEAADELERLYKTVALLGRRSGAHDELLAALKAVMEALRLHAPGTPLNNHRFDALGVKAYSAIAKAEAK